jgi:cell division protein FtsI (penicillin-binding protein 3)
MKPSAFPKASDRGALAAEAAPARGRIKVVAFGLMAVFLGLSARATQLAVAGDPLARPDAKSAVDAPTQRADIVDRNGALLATTLPSYSLIAEPAKVWDAPATARALSQLFTDLDAAVLERRLTQSGLELVYLKRDLSPHQRDLVFEYGLAGVSFREESTRVYPQGDLAAHLLGGVNASRRGIAGVESGLDAEILRAGANGKPVRLSIDVRAQHALEAELQKAVNSAHAEGGAGLILSARTGEVLAMASAPNFNPNDPPASDNPRRLNRAAGAVYEMGSSMKPFTVAMGLEAGVTRADEIFDLSKTLTVDGFEIKDFDGLGRPASLTESLADSSNIMAATIALRVGPVRQRAALKQLGFYDRAPIQAPESARPLPPKRDDALTTAVLGYGHGMASSLAVLAGAYTVFANDGRRAPLTLLAREGGDAINYTPVFSKESARIVLGMMRQVVTSGTGKRADVPGLEIAGKTGSAEKPHEGVYEPDVLFSSFAAVFPASNPKYVIVLALDEPQRTAESGNLATGGAVAAPSVGAIAARLAALPAIEAAR